MKLLKLNLINALCKSDKNPLINIICNQEIDFNNMFLNFELDYIMVKGIKYHQD